MIDAERMLGSLVRNALAGGRRGRRGSRRRRPSRLGAGTKGALALGALGVAIAAFEHFSGQQKAGATAGQGARPPLPPLPTPPVPETAPSELLPAPPGSPEAREEAVLLIRAMIAAANADHELDADERARILKALDGSGASEEDKQFLLAELERPAEMATLAARATTPERASQVYLASLMAIELDSPAERNYLDRLARRLGLEPARARELEEMLAGES